MATDIYLALILLVWLSKTCFWPKFKTLQVAFVRALAVGPLTFLFVSLAALPAHAAPKITVMTPTTGPVGTVVAIIGSGFGATQGSSTVKFNGTPVTWVSWSSTSLQVQVPAGAGSGNVVVTVGGTASNSESFTVTSSPVITSLSQSTGTVGSSLTISGSGFSANGTQTPQVVFSPSLYANPTSSTDTSVTVTVPSGATTGDLFVSVGGGNSNAVVFTVTSSDPSISNISPGSGTVGTSVTISGSNFGGTQGTSTVTFNGTTPTPTSWNSTTIVSVVPTGATTGNVVVTVGGVASNGYGFEVGTAAPNITSLSPNSGSVGTAITIKGTGFGSSQSGSTVNFNGVSGIPSKWSATSVTVPVPSGATTGDVVLNVGGTESNALLFTVPGTGPSITGLSANVGPVGASITISGANFGQLEGSSTVTFNGVAATATGWSANSVVASVPSGASSGNIVVTVNGISSNGSSFTVAPDILSVSPTSGTVGTVVTITGTSFGSSAGTVTFNGVAGVTSSWTAGSISVPVPAGATTGNVIVTAGGTASNGVVFTVLNSSFAATTGQMRTPRYGQTATQLATGQVLVSGGLNSSGALTDAELYSLSAETFTEASPMNVPRWLHTATLLNDGTVLITGGSSLSNETTLNSAEIFDPVAGTFTLLANTLNTARVGHTATLLSNGQVLIVGGYDPTTGIISDSELYDPIAQVFIDLGNTNTPRFHHTATLLQNGEVLLAGGETDSMPDGAYNSAEIFNPATWTFSSLSVTMNSAREGHAATLLNDGTVLITGGDLPPNGSLNTAEIYSPTANTFTPISATMTSPRIFHDAVLLNGGEVLLSGGESDSSGSSTALNTAELYNPTTQSFTATPGNMVSVREHQTATLLNDGTILEAGGTDGANIFSTAEIYTASQLTGLTSISITPGSPSVPLGSQQPLTATGSFSNGSNEVLSSVLWTSSSPSVSQVSDDASDNGYVTTLAQGTVSITATAAGVSGSTTVTVPAPALVSITVSPQNVSVPLGATQQLIATGTYSDGSTQDLTSTVTWTASSSSITVSSVGLVTAAALGTSTIQATSGSQSASTSVSVGAPALLSLSVTPVSATISVTQSQQYQAIGTYTDGSTQNLTSSVSWFATPQTSASINSAGLATAISQGSINITAAYGTFSGISTLTIGPAGLVSIAVLPSVASIPVGSNQQFAAIGTYSDGSTQDITSTVSWSSSSGTASSVNATGVATALAGGSSTISASSSSVTGTATLTVTTGTMALNTSRYQHSATLLNNGSVLIAGGVSCPSAGSCTYLNSAELYSPSAGTIANTGSMAAARTAPAVLLGNGKVLIAGGYSCDPSGNCSSLSSAEIYDPSAGTFSSAGNMTIDRYGHTMTLLSNGQVLIAGGETCSSTTSCAVLNTAELYNPMAGTFTATGNLNNARFNASAVELNSGVVLIAGGFNGTNFTPNGELYSPASGTFGLSGTLNMPRSGATITLLNNRQVIVAGGTTCTQPGCPTASTELYSSSFFSYPTYPTGNMTVARFGQTATLLTNGQVFFAGGFDTCTSTCISDQTSELFDPVAVTFASSQNLSTGRSGHTATLLSDGSVLMVGGINNGVTLSSTDSYQPASLAPPQLTSITISQSNPLTVGQTVVLSATGNFSDGSTQPLQSVIWSSTSPSVATVTNAAGSAGIVNALAAGTTTITSTVGSIVGSATITATTSLVSITVTPSSQTITIGSTQQLTLTATGTYSDGSTLDLTSEATWNSSNTSIATVFDIPGSPAIVVPAAPGTTMVSASLGNVSGNANVTVNMPLAQVPPNISTVSPPSGAAGTHVTITGSGFGATQGSGTIWLGTNLGSVISWSDSQVVATVSTGSSSGAAEIQQSNGTSNSVPFSINTAAIGGVSPNNGLPGTQVTISGSGFGAAQGNGNVWLGTVLAIVNSWSDGQVVATVAAGAASGNAQILQNGVLSNAVPFTINLPHVTGVSPNSGSAGTVVAITGSGFGAAQGSGNVWIGSTYAPVTGWSDTQIVASVGSNAVSGIVKVNQNGTWSNAITFTVPPSFGSSGSGSSVTLVPNFMNMAVGNTQQLEALDANGNSVTGLTWNSSNLSVATLSTDDPPILTAVAVGNATITAGNASADVTVWAGTTLPTGTPIWSNPGDGSGVSSIVPAVPSPIGVADVFAVNQSGNVQAIRADGTTAWTQSVGGNTIIPDFQGGAVVYTGSSIYRLDGLTGQPSTWTYTSASGNNLSTPVVHTSGTIFTIDGNLVVGINPTNGQTFSVALENWTSSGTGQCYNVCSSPLPPQSPPSSSYSTPPTTGSLMIAGDGYAYVAYMFGNSNGNSQSVCQPGCGCFNSFSSTQSLRLLRVGLDGNSNEISLGDFPSAGSEYNCWNGQANSSSSATPSLPTLITNRDQGVLASYSVNYITNNNSVSYTNSGPVYGPSSSSNTTSYYLATTSGPSLASNSQVAMVLEQTSPVQPILQRQDGNFIGTVSSSVGSFMVAFTPSGGTLFTAPNDTPEIATADNGVIGTSGTAYDQNGNVTGQTPALTPNPSQSSAGQWPGWLGNAFGTSYSIMSGGATSLAAAPIPYASTYAALSGGNNSSQGTAIQQVQTNHAESYAKQLPDLSPPIICGPGLATELFVTPTCGNINAIELLTSASPDYIFQEFIQKFLPVSKKNNSIMTIDTPTNGPPIVSGVGQILRITLNGFFNNVLQPPFYVMTERFDEAAHTISVVTLEGHPLAGWRYWRVYSIGTNDVVVETAAYDQPGPAPLQYAGYYVAEGAIHKGWQEYMQYIQSSLHAPQGSQLSNSLGGIPLRKHPFPPTPWVTTNPLLEGYVDYLGDFTSYILNNVCQAASCN